VTTHEAWLGIRWASGVPADPPLIRNPSHALAGVTGWYALSGAARARPVYRLAAIAPSEPMASG